ncbi:GIN domain-containing protein [Flagellimonas lutaonensis]|uniref:Putative auto-transporter adhesin head GIN domain-containing protein n=1 Tax=Flagellimonas lutaonensis TaxID=516051 RepID=A0A0D5YUI2_9FLAO|nr:DUF2807 domain-containing protein [Allomuricauda lutaonensis]AKA35536.1 hypothetical protein VC82_1931 [Allomuricauda lutaonensis]
MKKFLLPLLLLFMVSMTAQRKPKIKGNRVVTEVNGELPSFNAIVLEDNLDIVLKKSFGPGYRIEADDNLVDILKFKVEDSTLVISSFYTVTSKKKFNITVEFVELKAISAQEGSIVSEDIITNDRVFIDAFGNSEMNLSASASVLDLNMEETSSGDLNLDVDSLNINLRGRSKPSIYMASGTATLELQDNANLVVEGTSDNLFAKVGDNAKLKAQRMEAALVKLHLEGSADAHVYAYREFELSSKGNGKTFLYGTPKITITEFLDTSQLVKKVE